MTCAIKSVGKPKTSLVVTKCPTKTNRSIIETPVTISGFIIGILVTVKTAFLIHFFRFALIPTAASVPIISAKIEDVIAKTSVFDNACNVIRSLKSSQYHFKEKPESTLVLLVPLKDITTMTAIGAYKNSIISAI